MKKPRKLEQIPEILYEAPSYPGEKTSPIPYFESSAGNDAPIGLFILEYKHTGEYEQGTTNRPEEIMDGPYPHMYVEFDYVIESLKEKFPQLNMDTLVDDVRTAIGLKPLSEAKASGEKLLLKVESKAKDLENKAKATQTTRVEKIKKDLN